MFPGNMQDHYKELVELLHSIIARLDDPSLPAEQVELFARRHIHYALTPTHYKLIEEAMLWTLERALGNDCNDHVLTAWKNCYAALVEKTIAASEVIVK